MTMWLVFIAIFTFGFITTDGQILLYDTDNDSITEKKFDCVYYVYNDGEEIPYCRRLSRNEQDKRSHGECQNGGEMKSFSDLLKQGVKPSDILHLSSSVEMADLYASIFYSQTSIEAKDYFLCNCTKSGTFGKYCEYHLTHNANSFGEAIRLQFQQKQNGDSWNTQRYGKILCYETIPFCNSGDLCLDWRDICDGHEQCRDGIDEENWDKLEFNECEDDEFRCTNGMCIAEEFWLDGEYTSTQEENFFIFH